MLTEHCSPTISIQTGDVEDDRCLLKLIAGLVFCVPAAHQSRVTVVLFVLEMEWLLSTGQDKNFTWHCSESGQQLGTYHTAAWVTGLQYPLPSSCLRPDGLFALPAKWSEANLTKWEVASHLWPVRPCFMFIMTTQPILRPQQGDGD